MQNIELTAWDIQRFWRYVDKRGNDACWMWTGAQWGNPNYKDNFYGKLGVMADADGVRKQIFLRAHRISFYLHNGHWPIGLVLHECDTPLCVNPAHLRDGTHKDNTEDMTNKNRHGGRFEEGHAGYKARAKITQEISDQIRLEYVPAKPGGQKASETSIKGLARKYGLSPKAVQFIVRGEHWATP